MGGCSTARSTRRPVFSRPTGWIHGTVVAEMRNSSGDRAFSATGQVQKRFGGGELSLAYTYTDARDRMSANCFNVTCNLDFTPLDGTLDDRRLSTSNFEAKHKITLGATARSPSQGQAGPLLQRLLRAALYLYGGRGCERRRARLLRGQRPRVPAEDAADITLDDPAEWPALDSMIRSQRCLEAQRGHVMRRNSCRTSG